MSIQSDVSTHFLRQNMHREAANHNDNYTAQKGLLSPETTIQDGTDTVSITCFET